MEQADSRVLTILLTALKGADGGARATRSDAVAWAEKHKQIVVPTLQREGGRLVKTLGDSLVFIFDSATDAVLAACAVQEQLFRYNSYKALSDRLELRVAVGVGEVSIMHEDVIGEPVNAAAAVLTASAAGDVCLTEAAYLAMNKAEVNAGEAGDCEVPGAPERVRVYKVLRGFAAGGKRTGSFKAILKRVPLRIPFASRRMVTAGITLLALGGLIAFFNYRGPAPSPAAPAAAERIDQGACQEDLKKFCPGVPHGGGKQAECLRDHLAELAAECTQRGFMKDYAAKHPAWAREHGLAP